ncbi:MAG: hypothetical protein ABFQ62_02190 [Patescibacteria group bacterium]
MARKTGEMPGPPNGSPAWMQLQKPKKIFDYSLKPATEVYTQAKSFRLEEDRNAVIAQALQAQR